MEGGTLQLQVGPVVRSSGQDRVGLLAQTELLDDFPVAADFVALQVCEQTTPASDELQKPSAGSVILLVCLEMLS